MTTRLSAAEVERAVADIPDPEVPVLSIADLGILRSVRVDEVAERVEVVVTPTYSGCPAMEAITGHIAYACRAAGWEPVVTTRLSPAWTTDWMSEAGREKLRAFGISPPVPGASLGAAGPVPVALARRQVACPRCGSTRTTEIAHFGSTACKALRRCEECREPFDEFKSI